MRSLAAITMLVAALAASARGEEIVSGLAAGEHPQPLQVRDCTGPAAGKTLCYTCRYAERPTIAIFARELSPSVARLAQRIDTAVEEHRAERLAAYVVILADDSAELQSSLKAAAKEHDLRHVPLTILRDRPAKLKSAYAIADEAELTVMHWRDGTVAATRGYSTSALTNADIARIVTDIAAILD